MAIAKEQIRQIIAQNDISNAEDVYVFMKEGFRDILKEVFEAEMDASLGYPKNHKGDISGIEEQVISLYARGMSTRDIQDQVQDLYGIEMSAEMVSKITDKIILRIKEWQSRPCFSLIYLIYLLRANIGAMSRGFSKTIINRNKK